MKNTLIKLSDYQLKALDKKIEFDVDLCYGSNKSAIANVRLNYSLTGDIRKNYIFSTTFDDSLPEKIKRERLNNIEYFINNIVK